MATESVVTNESFRKLSIPPRLNDRLLDPVSVEDHAKYLSLHNRLRNVLSTIRRRGMDQPLEIRRFGQAADWLRTFDRLYRRWCPPWAFAYLHHTCPMHHGFPVHVSAETFGFLWFHGFADRETLTGWKLQVSPFHCLLCGRRVEPRSMVLRWGVPCCGCGKPNLRPTSAYVIVSDDFPRLDIVRAFRLRCLEQRMIDPDAGRGVDQGMVVAFVRRRQGASETMIGEAAARGLPVFVLGEVHAESSGHQQPVGGLKL